MLYAIYARGGKAFAREPEEVEEAPTEEKHLGWRLLGPRLLKNKIIKIETNVYHFLEGFWKVDFVCVSNLANVQVVELKRVVNPEDTASNTKADTS